MSAETAEETIKASYHELTPETTVSVESDKTQRVCILCILQYAKKATGATPNSEKNQARSLSGC